MQTEQHAHQQTDTIIKPLSIDCRLNRVDQPAALGCDQAELAMFSRSYFLSPAVLMAGCVAVAAVVVPAKAAYEDQAAQTKAYALKAVEFYKSKGLEGAKASFLTPKAWVLDPEHYNLHVSGLSNDQMVWADSGFPEVVGQSFQDVEDLDGIPLGKSVWDGLAKTPAGASIQLRFSNPVTKAVAHTEGYCVQADPDNVICAWSQTN